MTQYRVPELSTYSWQQPVINQLADPPATPGKGDRYIVIATASGDWAGHEGDIAWCSNATGPVWSFDTPAEGWQLWDKNANAFYYHNGTSWGTAAGHTQNTDTGTTSDTFQLNNDASGPKLKDNSGVTEIRNAADDAYANIKAADVVATGNITDGTNATSPANIKTSYDRRAQYDADLGCVVFEI
jgi:hypothetical protein